jgi:hypothetical protein
MMGIVIRIAQRMGIDTEATNAKNSVLEAELVCTDASVPFVC